LETRIRGTGGANSSSPLEYEASALMNVLHLSKLLELYLKTYGEELSPMKHNKILIDFIHVAMTDACDSLSHRWLHANFKESLEFMELFKKELFETLKHCFPLWREYPRENLVVSIDSIPTSLFIGYKIVLRDCNRDILKRLVRNDTVLLDYAEPLFTQDYVVNLANSTYLAINEQELAILQDCKISWALVIEDCLRTITLLIERNINSRHVDQEIIASLLDVDELKIRFVQGDVCSRLTALESESAAYTRFDSIISTYADILLRIIQCNYALFVFMRDQLSERAMQIPTIDLTQPAVAVQCINLTWLNSSAIVTFGCFDVTH